VQPFKGIDTLGGIIGFSLYHEGVHMGIMVGLRKTIQSVINKNKQDRSMRCIIQGENR
jgi:hypothetical protein